VNSFRLVIPTPQSLVIPTPSEQGREYLRSLAALAAYDQGLNPGVASEQQELRLDAMDRAIDVADAAMQAALGADDDN
jgi:hypothetical protein